MASGSLAREQCLGLVTAQEVARFASLLVW